MSQTNDTFVSVTKRNIFTENPVLVQVLGICSTLAVTNSVTNTGIMTIAVTLVTACSNFVLSSMHRLIPHKVRMITQTLVISFFVIIVDILLQAKLPEISKSLGPYVGLVITNCIIMGRAEAFAQGHKPLISFWDGFTSGLGYMGVLLLIAVVREILGFGTLVGFQVMPDGFTPWTLMVMAPSGFFMLAIMLWLSYGMRATKKEGNK